MASQREYEQREIDLAYRQMEEVRRAPLRERKEAQLDFFEAMRDAPDIVAERVDWLLGGNYGYGPMLLAQRIFASPRMNREAALTQMIGVFEWMTPEDMTRAAWKKLTASEKHMLSQSVRGVIRAHKEEELGLGEAMPHGLDARPKFLTLDRLLQSGDIWIERGEYIGRASDGIIVSIGTIGFEQDAERYLRARPDPKDW